MRPLDIKEIRRRGKASERPRFPHGKAILIALATAVALGGTAYGLFFSGTFNIRDVAFNGVETANRDDMRSALAAMMDETRLGWLHPFHNILFFRVSRAETILKSEFPVMKSVAGKKHLLHALAFDVVERKPVGVWCFEDDCRYFDADGATWGPAIKSSGFLFLTVVDHHAKDAQIEPMFLHAALAAREGMQSLPMGIRQIAIPAGLLLELDVLSEAGYPIRLATDTDIVEQFRAFKVFLNQHPVGDFHPGYVDLRIPGRIYYK